MSSALPDTDQSNMRLQVTESGELVLPAELVQAPPQTQMEVERQGNTVVIKLTPAVLRSSSSFEFPNLPGHLIDETITFRREDLYDDPIEQ